MRERENMKISNSRKSSYINRVASIFLFLSLLSPFAATAGITIASSYTTNETMTITTDTYIKGNDTVLTVAKDKQVKISSAAGRIILQDGATLKTAARSSYVINSGVKESSGSSSFLTCLKFNNGGTAIATFENNADRTGVVWAVSGDCAIKRCDANQKDDGFFSATKKPWHIRASEGTKLLIDANEGECLLNKSGSPLRIYDYHYSGSTPGAAPCKICFKINGTGDSEGKLIFNAGCSILITNKLEFASDNTGVFEFADSSTLNGPRNIDRLSGDCVLVINKSAKAFAYNIDLRKNGNSIGRICGDGVMNIIASNSESIVTADFPNEVRLSATNIVNSLELRKYGSKNLYLNAPTVQKLTIKEGAVIVRQDMVVNYIVVEKGAKIVVDGAELRFYGKISDDQIEFINGGRAFFMISGDETEPDAAFCEKGMCRMKPKTYAGLIKTGPDELIVYDPCEITGKVHVKGGVLRFSSRSGIDDKYIRFTAKECHLPLSPAEPKTHKGLAIKVGLYDTNDDVIDLGTDAKSIYDDTPVCNFKPNSFSAPNPNALIIQTYSAEPAGAFARMSFTNNVRVGSSNSTVNNNYMPVFINATKTVCHDANDESGWIKIMGRLPDDMRAMDGANIASVQTYGLLKTWTIETSKTGKDGSWRVIQDIKDSPRAKNNVLEGFLNDNAFKPAYHFRYVSPGFTGLADVVQIEVNERAELDFSSKTAGQTINEITMGGSAGTVKGIVFAENGSIQINDGKTAAVKNGYLPLIIENCQLANNLPQWKVFHNGMKLRKSAAYDQAAKKLYIFGSAGTFIKIQ